MSSDSNPQRLKQLIHLAVAVGERVEVDAGFVEQRQVEIGQRAHDSATWNAGIPPATRPPAGAAHPALWP